MSRRLSLRARQLIKKIKNEDDPDKYWQLMGELHSELGAPPWEWPIDIDGLK